VRYKHGGAGGGNRMTATVAQPSDVVVGIRSVQADAERGDKVYNEFYRTGGWKYSFWREYRWHRRHVVKRFRLRRGMSMLEAACGSGFHTNLFNRMGFHCIGVDRSRMGIAWAREHYPRNLYYRFDIGGELPVDRGGFDVVLARGCSHYHYDLMTDQARTTTLSLMGHLKPGGVFIMVIVTDLSGRRDPDQIWHNTLADYERHFSSFGLRWSVDWATGTAICGLWNERA
jgi:SAM-dependent methyltransferase